MDIIHNRNIYTLMLPGVNLSDPDDIVLFRVDRLLDLMKSGQRLIGHPTKDLEAKDNWFGTKVGRVKVQKILGWMRQDRLVLCHKRPSGSLRITYIDKKGWLKWITETDYQWLQALCDGSLYDVEQELAQQAGRFWAEFWAAAGAWAEQAMEKRPKAKKAGKLAKARRKQQRMEALGYE